MRCARARTFTESIWIRPIRSTTACSPRIVGTDAGSGRRPSSPWARRAMRRACAADRVERTRGRAESAPRSRLTRSSSRAAPTLRAPPPNPHLGGSTSQFDDGALDAARRRHRDVQADHSVAPAASSVGDRWLRRLGVDEQVEVVTDQLHLVQGVLDRDRRSVVHLLPDHHRGVAESRLDHVADGGSHLGRRSGRLLGRGSDVDALQRQLGVVVLAALVHPAKALHELRGRDVERRVAVVGGCLGPNHGSLVPHRQLDAFRHPSEPRIALMGDLNVDPVRARRVLPDLGELLLDVATEPLGHIRVPTDDDDLHGNLRRVGAGGPLVSVERPWALLRGTTSPPSDRPRRESRADVSTVSERHRESHDLTVIPVQRSRHPLIERVGRGVAASTRAPTTSPPPDATARSHAARVAPVVTTSSTRTTTTPGGNEPLRRTLRARFRWRPLTPSPTWSRAAPTGARQGSSRAGTPRSTRPPATDAASRRSRSAPRRRRAAGELGTGTTWIAWLAP